MLSIHYYENGEIVFRMAAVTPGHSSMNMARHVTYADFPPTQPLVTVFSLGFRNKEVLDNAYEMKVDWYYYSSDPSAKLWPILQHVTAIRAVGIERLHIVAPGETVEYFRVSKDQISAYSGDCLNGNPPDPPTVELLDPTETQGNADYVWVVRPTPRATLNYVIEWREKYIYENGERSRGFREGGLTRQTRPKDAPYVPGYGNVLGVKVSVKATDLRAL